MARRKELRARVVLCCVVCVLRVCSSRACARVYFFCRRIEYFLILCRGVFHAYLGFPHNTKVKDDGKSQTAFSKRDDDIIVIIGEETRTLLRKRVARFGEIVGMLRVHATDGIARANAMVRKVVFVLIFSQFFKNFLHLARITFAKRAYWTARK